MRDFLLRENNIGVLLLLSIDSLPAECLLSCHAYCMISGLMFKETNIGVIFCKHCQNGLIFKSFYLYKDRVV